MYSSPNPVKYLKSVTEVSSVIRAVWDVKRRYLERADAVASRLVDSVSAGFEMRFHQLSHKFNMVSVQKVVMP